MGSGGLSSGGELVCEPPRDSPVMGSLGGGAGPTVMGAAEDHKPSTLLLT